MRDRALLIGDEFVRLSEELEVDFKRGVPTLPQPSPRTAAPMAAQPAPSPAPEEPEEPTEAPVEEPAEAEPELCPYCMKAASESGAPFINKETSAAAHAHEEADADEAERWVLCQKLLWHDGETPYVLMQYELEYPSGRIESGETDAEGVMRHEVDEEGDHSIRLVENPFEDEDELPDDPEDEPDDEDDEILCATLIGGDSRAPLAGVEVEVPAFGATVETDENGYFELEEVPMGEFEIRVAGQTIVVPSHDEPDTGYRVRVPGA